MAGSPTIRDRHRSSVGWALRPGVGLAVPVEVTLSADPAELLVVGKQLADLFGQFVAADRDRCGRGLQRILHSSNAGLRAPPSHTCPRPTGCRGTVGAEAAGQQGDATRRHRPPSDRRSTGTLANALLTRAADERIVTNSETQSACSDGVSRTPADPDNTPEADWTSDGQSARWARTQRLPSCSTPVGRIGNETTHDGALCSSLAGRSSSTRPRTSVAPRGRRGFVAAPSRGTRHLDGVIT